MDRPTCKMCMRNACRYKGGRKADGSSKYDYKCAPCHKRGLKGNPTPCLTRKEHIAFVQIPQYEARLQRLMKQIGDLRPIVAEYRAIKKKVRIWRERQAAKKANKPKQFWGQERYKRHKKDSCGMCGFIAKHSCQLDVDHIDGNGMNHDPINLQTLCANCHRLKTFLSGDHLTPRGQPASEVGKQDHLFN